MANAIAATTVATPATSTEAAPKFANFRDFNSFAAECRVIHQEVKAGEFGEFVQVTCVTNLKDGAEGVAVQFRASTGILKLAKGGHLMPGRRVHVTGAITGFATSYLKDGQAVMLQRPRLNIAEVNLRLGAKPKKASA